jgi:RecA-family ATPase
MEHQKYSTMQDRFKQVDPRIDPAEVERAKQQRLAELNGKPAIEQLKPVAIGQLEQDYPKLHEPIIDGLLRIGETANIIAPPKTGKSFLAGGLAWSVAVGRPWLDRDVQQGNVLILDNELHPATIANRLDRIAWKMEIDPNERVGVDVVSLRGKLTSVADLQYTVAVEPGQYRLIVIDALYRMLPKGISENDNAAMTGVYNELDNLANKWQAAIVVVHHSSKGNQGEKSVTDVGAGAGAIARAADTHIAIREHETEGHHLIEARSRSFPSPKAVSIKYEYPVWTATTLEPAVKRATKQNRDAQAESDRQATETILNLVPEYPKRILQSDLIRLSGFGVSKATRILGAMESAKTVKRFKKKQGTKSNVYYRKPDPSSESSSESDSE